MAFDDELYIGTNGGGVNGMVKISSLGSPHISEGSFSVDPAHRSAVVVLGDGTEQENGWLQCGWHINGLRASQFDALSAYKSAHSTRVYIRTLDNDGETFKNYSALMIWPVKPVRGDPMATEGGQVFDFELKFIQLVEQV
jgi:hypothetical protein